MPLTPFVLRERVANRETGMEGLVVLRGMVDCADGPPVPYPMDSLSRLSSSSASSLITDLPKLRCVKDVLTGEVGEKRFCTGNSPLPRPGVPLGGDIFSMLWKVPLYRDDCRPFVAAPAIPDAVETDPCRTETLSTVLRLEPMVPGKLSWSISTMSVASLEALRFPLSRLRASFAPSKEPNCATADANPLSSGYLDAETSSQSMRSLAKSKMLRTASRSLLLGSLRKNMAWMPLGSGLVSASLKESKDKPFFSMMRRSPMGAGMVYVCDAAKTSAVMVFWGEKRCFGGEDEVELLREP